MDLEGDISDMTFKITLVNIQYTSVLRVRVSSFTLETLQNLI